MNRSGIPFFASHVGTIHDRAVPVDEALAAAFNPIRRPEWWKDAPAVLGLTVLAAPVIVPASLLAVGGRLVLRAASSVARLFRR